MPVDILVCVKQVPHPDSFNKISLDPDRGTVVRESLPTIINPGDRHALEEALRVREQLSGRVIVLTMGPPQARKALEEALAMGPDAAIHLCDRSFAGADTLATAQALAHAIRKFGRFDLILCGDATIDSGTGQVAIQLAELLNLPGITAVEELVLENAQNVLAKRRWEGGYVRIRVKLPAVIAVTDKINQPRLPNVLSIMAATQKEMKTWSAADIGADVNQVGLIGSPTQFFEICKFQAKRQGEILQGTTEEVVARAIDRLIKLEML